MAASSSWVELLALASSADQPLRRLSVGPGGRIAVEPEPAVAWISVAGVVVSLAAILVGEVVYRRRSR